MGGRDYYESSNRTRPIRAIRRSRTEPESRENLPVAKGLKGNTLPKFGGKINEAEKAKSGDCESPVGLD